MINVDARASLSCGVFIALAFVSCGIDHSPEVARTATNTRALDPTMPQILGAAALAEYKAALPHVAYKKLEDILQSPSTLWWDKETMIPSYQDSVGDGSFTPIGA